MSQSQTQRSSRVDLLHGSILKSLLLFALHTLPTRKRTRSVSSIWDSRMDCGIV